MLAREMQPKNMTNIFIDTSALVALYLKKDDFHPRAIAILKKHKEAGWFTSNFVLDEVYTFLRARCGKKVAIKLAEFLASNSQTVRLIRVTIEDEKEAFRLFCQYDFKNLSFTDCTSFALMKRLKLKTVFAFDRHFIRAGFRLLV